MSGEAIIRRGHIGLIVAALTALPFPGQAGVDLCPPLDGLVGELKANFLPIKGERDADTGHHRTRNLLGAQKCWIDDDELLTAYQCSWGFAEDQGAASRFFGEMAQALGRCIAGKALPAATFGPAEEESSDEDGFEIALVRHAVSHPSLLRPAYVAVKLVLRKPATLAAGHEVFLDLVRAK